MSSSTINLSSNKNNEAIENGRIKESDDKAKLRSWLNRYLRIKMTDGRVLIGTFLCTDRDANVILGSCEEYLTEEHSAARALGLVMVPGRHIVSIYLDEWFKDETILKKRKSSTNE